MMRRKKMNIFCYFSPHFPLLFYHQINKFKEILYKPFKCNCLQQNGFINKLSNFNNRFTNRLNDEKWKTNVVKRHNAMR